VTCDETYALLADLGCEPVEVLRLPMDAELYSLYPTQEEAEVAEAAYNDAFADEYALQADSQEQKRKRQSRIAFRHRYSSVSASLGNTFDLSGYFQYPLGEAIEEGQLTSDTLGLSDGETTALCDSLLDVAQRLAQSEHPEDEEQFDDGPSLDVGAAEQQQRMSELLLQLVEAYFSNLDAQSNKPATATEMTDTLARNETTVGFRGKYEQLYQFSLVTTDNGCKVMLECEDEDEGLEPNVDTVQWLSYCPVTKMMRVGGLLNSEQVCTRLRPNKATSEQIAVLVSRASDPGVERRSPKPTRQAAERRRQSEDVRALLRAIAEKRLLIHVDRYANVLPELSVIMNIPQFYIETE